MASPSPPLPGLTKKPHFSSPEEPSTTQQIPSKSHSNPICKTLIVLALLLIIPFFPSQPPDFISQTIFTQFWEIIHLLFIGIAVSYGLFGRKTAQKIEISRNDDESNGYLTGISHISSIFECGSGNMCCEPDEQDLIMQSYYANCSCQCFGDQSLGKTRCVVHGSSAKIRSLVSKNGKENIIFDNNSDGQNVKNQTWSSKYSKGESLVVVSNGLGESLDFKPLNLPLRSLRSSVVVNEKQESPNRNGSSSKIEAKGKNDIKGQMIRGLVPTNLEKRFEESDADGLPSIPWHSRSGRMEKDGNEFNNIINPRAHYRPRSVEEFEFERIKSRPSNKVSSFSSSPESASSEVDNAEGEISASSEVDNAEGEMVMSVSHPKLAPVTGDEASLSVDSKNREEGRMGKGKQPIMSLDSDKKPLSRAKSVRTLKPSRYEALKRVKSEETESPIVNDQPNREIGCHFPVPKPRPSLPDFFNNEENNCVEQNVTESEDDGDKSELDESCDDEDDAKTNVDYDLGSEVDRKAGEFIAKFREQIRRQKASTVEGYSREFV
ncbi:hypothetical protein CASFOL_041771 [Castilleja foliolosa]|uniref:Uncharacterized protein n=1 Tax=Castilleja foliolosa TaxID=1961234 RepID=A0ABD3B9U9_9LAMI